MRLKIHGGTVQHGEQSLCATCRHATIVKGRSLREAIVECDRLSSGHNLVPFPVTSCSGYSDRRLPSVRDMEDIAWVLRTDPARNRIGFIQARELKPKDRYVLPDDDDWS
jgi:hypothetical protein